MHNFIHSIEVAFIRYSLHAFREVGLVITNLYKYCISFDADSFLVVLAHILCTPIHVINVALNPFKFECNFFFNCLT